MDWTAIAPAEVDTALSAIFAAAEAAKFWDRSGLIENHAILEKTANKVLACVDEIVFRYAGYQIGSSELRVANITNFSRECELVKSKKT